MSALKNRAWAAAALFVLMGLCAGCGQPARPSQGCGYQKITTKEPKARMNSGDEPAILDVRGRGAYGERRIPGAVISNKNIAEEPLEQLPGLDARILVYCRGGNRSAQTDGKPAAGDTRMYGLSGINSRPDRTEGVGL